MKKSKRVSLIEKDVWEVKVAPETVLVSLAEITGNQFLVNRKKRTNLYVGKIRSTGFQIRENPSLTQMNPASGSLNYTVISGDIEPTDKGSLIYVNAHQFNFRSLLTIVGPVILGAAVLGSMPYKPWALLIGLSLITALELLLIRGINEEVRESLKVLEKRVRELERTHYRH